MAKHKNEIFLERVQQRKRDVTVVIAPVNRIDAHVMQEIVHPTHVPFEPEPKAAKVGRTGDARPCGGFLSDCDDAGETLVTDFVESFKKKDRVEILAAAIDVGDPLTGLSRVIEVKH